MKKPPDKDELEALAIFLKGWDAACRAVEKSAIERAHEWVKHGKSPYAPADAALYVEFGLIMLKGFIETDVRALFSDMQNIPPEYVVPPPKDMRH